MMGDGRDTTWGTIRKGPSSSRTEANEAIGVAASGRLGALSNCVTLSESPERMWIVEMEAFPSKAAQGDAVLRWDAWPTHCGSTCAPLCPSVVTGQLPIDELQRVERPPHEISSHFLFLARPKQSELRHTNPSPAAADHLCDVRLPFCPFLFPVHSVEQLSTTFCSSTAKATSTPVVFSVLESRLLPRHRSYWATLDQTRKQNGSARGT